MLKFAIPAVLAVAMLPAYSMAGHHGGGSGFSFSIGFGGGGCYSGYSGAYYGAPYCGPRYYCAPPVVYRPVYVAPAPVVVYAPPPAPVYYYPAPAPCYPSGGYFSASYYGR